MRDPRTDPRPGDVLAKRRGRRRGMIRLRVCNVTRGSLGYTDVAIADEATGGIGTCWLSEWQTWAKKARVIRTAEESEAS